LFPTADRHSDDAMKANADKQLLAEARQAKQLPRGKRQRRQPGDNDDSDDANDPDHGVRLCERAIADCVGRRAG
jgi:hypothetical protein